MFRSGSSHYRINASFVWNLWLAFNTGVYPKALEPIIRNYMSPCVKLPPSHGHKKVDAITETPTEYTLGFEGLLQTGCQAL